MMLIGDEPQSYPSYCDIAALTACTVAVLADLAKFRKSDADD